MFNVTMLTQLPMHAWKYITKHWTIYQEYDHVGLYMKASPNHSGQRKDISNTNLKVRSKQ